MPTSRCPGEEAPPTSRAAPLVLALVLVAPLVPLVPSADGASAPAWYGQALGVDDPMIGDIWGPQAIHAPEAWTRSLGSTAGAVCIVSSGARLTHEDLDPARYLGGVDLVENDATPQDTSGWGTTTLSSAAATVGNGKGIAGAGNVGYYVVRALPNEVAANTPLSRLAEGVRWCADHTQPRTVIAFLPYGNVNSAEVTAAFDDAYAKGKLITAPVGDNLCNTCMWAQAKHPTVIAALCLREDLSPCLGTGRGLEGDFGMPGWNARAACHIGDASYCGGYGAGTLDAAALLAGALAYAWGELPALTNAQLWQRANATVRAIPYYGPHNVGRGILDLKCLVDGDVGCVPAAPAPSVATYPYDISFDAGGAPGWQLSGLWHVQACRAASGASALGYARRVCPLDDDFRASSGQARSPAIPLPPEHTNLVLTWKSYHDANAECCYFTPDLLDVEVSTDLGATWTRVHRETGTERVWNARSVDLAPYAGSSLLVRFAMSVPNADINSGQGWLIDDVHVGPASRPGFPDVPATLAAATGAARGEIALAWTAPPAVDPPVTGYRVYRSSTSWNAGYQLVATRDGATFSFVDAGLPDDALRWYQVAGVSDAGEGIRSDPVSARTWYAPRAPAAWAERGPGVGELTVRWSAPDAVPAPTGYRVRLADTTLLAELGADARVFTLGGLGPGQYRTFEVAAVNDVGEGAPSAPATERAFEGPQPPTAPVALGGPQRGELTFAWAPPADDGGTPVLGYLVEVAPAPEGPWSEVARSGGGGRIAIVSGLGDDATRWMRATAWNAVGEGEPSAAASARTFHLPTAPRFVNARPGDEVREVLLTWFDPTDKGAPSLLRFEVLRDGAKVAEVPGTSFAWRELMPVGVLVARYEVRAVNVIGASPAAGDCSFGGPLPELGANQPCPAS